MGDRNKWVEGVWDLEFSELFNKLWGDFCNFLMNARRVATIPKQGVGHCSENFE